MEKTEMRLKLYYSPAGIFHNNKNNNDNNVIKVNGKLWMLLNFEEIIRYFLLEVLPIDRRFCNLHTQYLDKYIH